VATYTAYKDKIPAWGRGHGVFGIRVDLSEYPTAPVGSDVIKLITIPAGTLLRRVDVVVRTAASSASAAKANLGTGSSYNTWYKSGQVNLKSTGNYIANGSSKSGKYYASDTDFGMKFVSVTASKAVKSAVIDVMFDYVLPDWSYRDVD